MFNKVESAPSRALFIYSSKSVEDEMVDDIVKPNSELDTDDFSAKQKRISVFFLCGWVSTFNIQGLCIDHLILKHLAKEIQASLVPTK